VQHRGKAVHYIEVTLEDIAITNRLAHDVLGRTLDELPPQTRKLLTTLHAWVKEECKRQSLKQTDFHFSRRQVRELTGWGNSQLAIHLDRLADMEYLQQHGGKRGQLCSYELAYNGEGESGQSFLMGLLDADALATTAASFRGETANLPGSFRPHSAPVPATFRGEFAPVQASIGAVPDESDDEATQTAYFTVARNGSCHSLLTTTE
jgi:DNA primase